MWLLVWCAGDPNRVNPPFVGPEGINAEGPLTPEDVGASTLQRGRCKKYITLDLKSPEGKELLKRLAADADVLVENFSARVMDGLDLSYRTLSEINPALIYCSISGFGHSGPYKDNPAFDTIIQAMSGLMDVTGRPEGPPQASSLAMGDLTAGYFAVVGILAALRHRRETGQGQAIDISMQDCLFSLVFDEALDALTSLGINPRTGNTDHRLFPHDVYACSDGPLALAVENENQWSGLCRLLGITDPRLKYSEDVKEKEERARLIDAPLREWLEERTREDAVSALREQGVTCGPVQSIEEVIHEPHLLERGVVVDVEHPTAGRVEGLKGSGFPVRFSESPVEYDSPAAPMGFNNGEVFCGLLGMSEDELTSLKERGVI